MIDKDIQPILGETKQTNNIISNIFTYDNNQYLAYIKKIKDNRTRAYVFLIENNEVKGLSLYTEYNVSFNKEKLVDIIDKFVLQMNLNIINIEDNDFIEIDDINITIPTLTLTYGIMKKAVSKYLSKCKKDMCSDCMFYNTCVLVNEQTNQLLCTLFKQTDNLNIEL